MIRATTGGVLRSYRKNLMNSFISQNKARDTVLTQRNFNSYAENPAAAAKCFRLRKSRMTVEGQIDVCSETYHKFEGAYQCLQSISQVIDTENAGNQLNTISSTTLRMLNDPTGDARTQLSKALDQMSENLVQNMNQTYGDVFIFAGADGHNVPFEIKTEDGQNRLYYRGVPVDAEVPDVLKNGTTPVTVNTNGEYDAAANPPAYLKTKNTEPISIAEYNSTYVPPTIEEGTITDPPFEYIGPLEYNQDGSPKKEGDPGGYYKITDGRTDVATIPDADGTGMALISIEKYNKIVSNSKDTPNLLQNAGGTAVTEVDENGVPANGGGYYLLIKGEPEDQVITKKDYETAIEDVAKLETLAKETQLVDIGLGFQEDNGKLIESSAFNAALQGISFLGYGVDQDGDPKNVYSIVQRLKEIADSVPDGEDWSTQTYDEFHDLVLKLEKAASNYKTEFTNFAAGTTKLKTNLDLLDNTQYNLQEQYAEMEDVNAADAISAFIWAQYSYNAALKVGNSILSESLMDYLR